MLFYYSFYNIYEFTLGINVLHMILVKILLLRDFNFIFYNTM